MEGPWFSSVSSFCLWSPSLLSSGRAGVGTSWTKSSQRLARAGNAQTPPSVSRCTRQVTLLLLARGLEGGWDLLCPGGLASIRSWRSQAQVDWPSPREGHIMAAQPRGSFRTLLPPSHRHPHRPLGWWPCLQLRPWLCGWLMWKFWEIKEDSLKRAGMHEASAEIGPALMLGLLTALQALRGGRGNGIHFVPPWLPPTTNCLERAFLWKRLLQPSVSGLCFMVSPTRLLFYCLYPDKAPGLFSCCVSARLGV